MMRVDRHANSVTVIDDGSVADFEDLIGLVQRPPVAVATKTGKSNKELEMNRALLGGAQKKVFLNTEGFTNTGWF